MQTIHRGGWCIRLLLACIFLLMAWRHETVLLTFIFNVSISCSLLGFGAGHRASKLLSS